MSESEAVVGGYERVISERHKGVKQECERGRESREYAVECCIKDWKMNAVPPPAAAASHDEGRDTRESEGKEVQSHVPSLVSLPHCQGH